MEDGSDVTVVAGSPQTDAGRFGFRVLDRRDAAHRAFLVLAADGGGLSTRNAKRLRLSGEALALTKAVDGTALDACASGSTVELCKSGHAWAPCTAEANRPPDLQGPMRHFFAKPWVCVVPDDATDAEVRLANYVTANHLVWAGTATQVRLFAQARDLRATHRFLFLGLDAHARFPPGVTGNWPLPVDKNRGVAVRDDCAIPANDEPAAAFLAPAAARADALDLVVTGLHLVTLEWLVATTFATNQPHTRAPFSNMLPDFVVVDKAAKWTGVAGIRATGYFDDDWRPASGFFAC